MKKEAGNLGGRRRKHNEFKRGFSVGKEEKQLWVTLAGRLMPLINGHEKKLLGATPDEKRVNCGGGEIENKKNPPL